MKKIVDGTTEEGVNYPVQPCDIKTTGRFWNAFDNTETEVSALYIVRLCQEKGGWIPFTKAEIDAFSREDFWFNRLNQSQSEDNFVVLGSDGKYRVTHEFIVSCFLSSPA